MQASCRRHSLRLGSVCLRSETERFYHRGKIDGGKLLISKEDDEVRIYNARYRTRRYRIIQAQRF